MAASDAWVCRYCRSVNKAGAGKCYRCHTPRDVAVASPGDLSIHHEESRPEAVGHFRSSETFAVLLTLAGVALILGSLVSAWVIVQIVQLRMAGASDEADRLFTDRQVLVFIVPLLAGLTLLAYAAWISRLVANLPTLGLGFSRVSPRWAFFEPFIPGRNLYSLPARTAEVAKKLAEGTGVSALIGLAWTLVVAPLPVLGIVSRVVTLVGSAQDLYAYAEVATPITAACLIAGLVVAIVVVWRVEGLQRARIEAAVVPTVTAA